MGYDNISHALNLLKCLLLTSVVFIVKAIPNPEVEDETSFSYITGAPNGPQNWSNLSPNWTLCGTGRSQSPIDILTSTVVVWPSLGSLARRYKRAPAVVRNRGHDIELEWTGDAGGIVINGSEFKLVQLHWHIPSEHTVNGVRFKMELHLVHVNSQGNIAVVGILYMLGSPDRFIQRLSPYLRSANQEGVDLGVINPSNIKFRGKKYYRYNGSLTTPPCSENVIWTVFNRARTVSIQQIKALSDLVGDNEKKGNGRPTQPLNGRIVYSNRPKH